MTDKWWAKGNQDISAAALEAACVGLASNWHQIKEDAPITLAADTKRKIREAMRDAIRAYLDKEKAARESPDGLGRV